MGKQKKLSQSRTRKLIIEVKRRAELLDKEYPSIDMLRRISDPAVQNLTIQHRRNLTAIVSPNISDRDIVAILTEAKQVLIDFQSNPVDEEDSDDASDCVAGCDKVFKDCLESWGEAIGGIDIDIFDGEAETQTGDDDSAIDDNPVDVENEDPGNTGGSDDSDDAFGDGLTNVEIVVASGFCSLQYTVCMAACVIGSIPG